MISSLPFYLLPGIRDHGSIFFPEKVKPIQVYTYKHPDVNLHPRCYFSTSGIYNNADQTGINLAKSVYDPRLAKEGLIYSPPWTSYQANSYIIFHQ